MTKQALFTTVLLVGVVFVIGMMLGNAWRSGESNEITKILRQSELDTESFLIEQELFESFETNCQLAEKRLGSLSGELWNLGKMLGGSDSEEKLGADNYKFLKRKYHLMQIRTYILDRRLKEDCGSKTNIILFYFKRQDPLSEQQGLILDELVEQYNLHVFAIEYQYSKELRFLEEYYELSSTPTIVINFENKFSGLITKEKIIPLLHG